MGIKVHPIGFRIGINKNWNSRWVAKNQKQTTQWLVEDDKIRKYFINKQNKYQVDHVEIERFENRIDIFVHAGQSGLLVGKDGENLKHIELAISKIVGRKTKLNINVVQLKCPSWSARVIAREIADSIEKRVSFRTAQKAAIRKVMDSRALGIKTRVSGRLNGVEMAREEGYLQGTIAFSTIRSDIDFAIEEAYTTSGIIGVKVWINRGEIFQKGLNNQIVPPDVKQLENNPRRRYSHNDKTKGEKK